MRFGHWNQPIQALPADGANNSFTNRIRLRAVRWRFQHAQSQRLDQFIRVPREDSVPVVNQVSVGAAGGGERIEPLFTALQAVDV